MSPKNIPQLTNAVVLSSHTRAQSKKEKKILVENFVDPATKCQRSPRLKQ